MRLRVDCSQSPIFSWDRLDIPRLTVTATNRPHPLGSFDTHARWVARNAKLSISMILRKIEDCEQSSVCEKSMYLVKTW